MFFVIRFKSLYALICSICSLHTSDCWSVVCASVLYFFCCCCYILVRQPNRNKFCFLLFGKTRCSFSRRVAFITCMCAFWCRFGICFAVRSTIRSSDASIRAIMISSRSNKTTKMCSPMYFVFALYCWWFGLFAVVVGHGVVHAIGFFVANWWAVSVVELLLFD